MTEVSNNLSSMYVQTLFKNTSRLQTDNKYEIAFSGIISKQAPHGTFGDVFGKLVPFWQLELYYAQAKGYTDFYADVYQKLRLAPNPSTDGEAQLNFVKVCCEVAQADLTGFFETWGMLTPIDVTISDYADRPLKITQAQIDEVKEYAAKYAAPTDRIQYIQDSNVDLYRTKTSIVKGTVSKSGSTFTLHFWKNVAACEVLDADGKLLLVTSKTSVTVPSGGTVVYAVSASGERVEVQVE
jgi:hypothetical protein